jgi:hypothetical protein
MSNPFQEATNLPRRLLSEAEIGKFIKHYVCARCYGDLQLRFAENRSYEALCPTCGDAWGSTVICRSTAERRAQQGMSEIREVRRNLSDLFPNPHHGKTSEQLITEIGY